MGGSVRTHYDTLSVATHTAPELVRKAYRQQAQKYHPDKLPGNADAQQVMAEINEAYAVLSDPLRRANYDRWIRAREQRLAAEQAAARAARPSGFAAAWPWYLLFATISFAVLAVGTVFFKAAVPSVATPVSSSRKPPPRSGVLPGSRMEPVAQATSR
jgi:DnaJ-class molecular chaperone